jgi:invasion protein IalB
LCPPTGAILSALLIGAAVPALGEAEQSQELRRFGDWEVLCGSLTALEQAGSSTTTNHRSGCRAVQRLAIQQTGETAFALTVLPGEKTGFVAIISMPLGGYLVPGVEFFVDGRKPYKLLIETCTITGCHAGFPLTGPISRDMRAGKSVSFRIWSSKKQSSEVKVSLKGFADALGHLERLP